MKPQELSITGVLIQDPVDNGFTAYFAEFPEVIAEGNTEEEAKLNLFDALSILFDFKREEAHLEQNGFKATTKSFHLTIA